MCVVDKTGSGWNGLSPASHRSRSGCVHREGRSERFRVCRRGWCSVTVANVNNRRCRPTGGRRPGCGRVSRPGRRSRRQGPWGHVHGGGGTATLVVLLESEWDLWPGASGLMAPATGTADELTLFRMPAGPRCVDHGPRGRSKVGLLVGGQTRASSPRGGGTLGARSRPHRQDPRVGGSPLNPRPGRPTARRAVSRFLCVSGGSCTECWLAVSTRRQSRGPEPTPLMATHVRATAAPNANKRSVTTNTTQTVTDVVMQKCHRCPET